MLHNYYYVRPIVEYASVVWSPHTQVLKNLLEMVQRKGAHFVFNSFARNISVTALLERLNWTTLENRRNHAKVTMFYKKINDIVSILSPLSATIIFNDSRPQSEVHPYLN